MNTETQSPVRRALEYVAERLPTKTTADDLQALFEMHIATFRCFEDAKPSVSGFLRRNKTFFGLDDARIDAMIPGITVILNTNPEQAQ